MVLIRLKGAFALSFQGYLRLAMTLSLVALSKVKFQWMSESFIIPDIPSLKNDNQGYLSETIPFFAWRGYLAFLNKIKAPLSLGSAWNATSVKKLWKRFSDLKSAISQQRRLRSKNFLGHFFDCILKYFSQKFESI